MKSYFVYIAKCADDTCYTGITGDLDRWRDEHNSKKDNLPYSSRKTPVQIIRTYEFDNLRQAIAFEKQIKSWSTNGKDGDPTP